MKRKFLVPQEVYFDILAAKGLK